MKALQSKLFQNIFYLFLSQGINYVLPFLALRFLFRVLGDDTYGIVATAYSYYIFLNIVIDFGYEYFATRKVSQNSTNTRELRTIVSETYLCKSILLLFALSLTIIIVRLVPNFKAYDSVFYLMMGVPMGTCFFSTWFFQGMQQMAFVTIVSSLAKGLSFLPMFIFVRGSEDVNIVSLCYSSGFVISAVVSFLLIRYRFKIKLVPIKPMDIVKSFKGSSLFFLSRVSASSYSVGITIILNVVCGNVISGYYDIASKLISAITNLINPITQALYPYMSSDGKTSVIKQFIKYGSVLFIVGFIFMELMASYIMILIFNVDNEQSINAFQILTLVMLFVLPSYLSGYPLLAAKGHDNYVNISVCIAALLFLVITGVLYIQGQISLYTMSGLYVFVEFFVFVTRIYGVKKYKLL